MDGVGKKMSEQAPGYFSFHFTQWQYVKNKERRRKGNIEIWGRGRMCEKNSIKCGSILNSSAQKQLQHFHGFFPLFFNPFCRTVLSEETGWDQNSANASESCATQGLTPENLLAMRHGDQPQPWCNSTDITGAALWQKLLPERKFSILRWKGYRSKMGSRIQWMAPFMRMESFGRVDWTLNCHCCFFSLVSVLERFWKKRSFHTHN